MRFSKIIRKTTNGQVLTDYQIKQLAKNLRLRPSLYSYLKIIIFACGVFGLIMLFIKNQKLMIINIIGLILFAAFSAFLFCYRDNKKRIILYLDALNEFYLKKFKDYEGFEMVFLQHQFQRSGFLQNNLCLLLTDGYEFYIFDDLLKETLYTLPKCFACPINKTPYLKVLDSDYINKKPIYFKTTEILSYYLNKPYNITPEKDEISYFYRRFTYVISKRELDQYCILELEDHSIFKFSPDAIGVLRRRIKSKEGLINGEKDISIL